jgi:4-hydroxybenzoate polyprenyltransferase
MPAITSTTKKSLMSNFFNPLIKVFIYSNIFVSFCAASLTAITKFILEFTSDNLYTEAAVFFATFSAYSFQSLANPIRSNIKQTERQIWLQSNRQILKYLLVFSIVAFFFFFSYLNNQKNLLFLLIPASIISVWYATDIKVYLKLGRLRNFPFLKIFCIAFAWIIMTVLFPAISAHYISDWNHVIWFAGERLLFLFAITLPFDIRDLEQDKQLGLKTFPILLGVQRIKVICYLFLLIFTTSVIIRSIFFQGEVTPINTSLIVTAIITAFIISFAHEKKNEIYFSVMLESTMVLKLLLVLLTSYV